MKASGHHLEQVQHQKNSQAGAITMRVTRGSAGLTGKRNLQGQGMDITELLDEFVGPQTTVG